MNHDRSFSSPELIPHSISLEVLDDSKSSTSNDFPLQGVATNVKLLLKIIQDHNNNVASPRKEHEGREMQRFAGMITILDDVKTRIQKSQSLCKREIMMRRCNSDLRPSRGIPRDKDKIPIEYPLLDDKQKLEKKLNDCLTTRKRLEKMFSSLGKEKEIISIELAKKVHELNEAEEQVNDLKSQNATLLEKVGICANKHKEKANIGAELQDNNNTCLQNRNKALSEQLLKSLEGYRSLKRKLKEVQEEYATFRSSMVEEISTGLNHIHALQACLAEVSDEVIEMQGKWDLSALKDILCSLQEKVHLQGSNNKKVLQVQVLEANVG